MNRNTVAFRLLSGFAGGCVMGFVLSRAFDALRPPELAATRAADRSRRWFAGPPVHGRCWHHAQVHQSRQDR